MQCIDYIAITIIMKLFSFQASMYNEKNNNNETWLKHCRYRHAIGYA